METKKLRIELDEVKVCKITLDLEDLENYMSKFLALKNHERNTREIVNVRGFNGTNLVEVVLVIEDEENENEEVEQCKDWACQFGNIIDTEVETAYILDKGCNGIDYALNYKEMYIWD